MSLSKMCILLGDTSAWSIVTVKREYEEDVATSLGMSRCLPCLADVMHTSRGKQTDQDRGTVTFPCLISNGFVSSITDDRIVRSHVIVCIVLVSVPVWHEQQYFI